VSRHHHGNPLRDTGTDKVSYGCAPEVVGNPAWSPGFLAGSLPGSPEFFDRFASPIEDPRADDAPLFQGGGPRLLALQDGP